jgi:hypothetical protein
MKFKLMYNFFYCLLLIVGCIACAPSKTLRLETEKIPIDRTFLFRQTTVTETEMHTPDGPNISTQTTTQDLSYLLLRRNSDGSTYWESQLLRYQEDKVENELPVHFDSANPSPDDNEVKKAIFAALDSVAFRFILSKEGEITQFEGLEEIWANLEDVLPPTARPIFKNTMQQFTDGTFSEIARNIWAFYPEKPIKKGKIWEKTAHIKMFNADKKSTYKLVKETADYNEISVESTTTGDPNKPGSLKLGPAEILYYLNGTSNGSIRLDKKLGFPSKVYSEDYYTGKMEVKVPTLAASKVPLTMRIKVTLLRID